MPIILITVVNDYNLFRFLYMLWPARFVSFKYWPFGNLKLLISGMGIKPFTQMNDNSNTQQCTGFAHWSGRTDCVYRSSHRCVYEGYVSETVEEYIRGGPRSRVPFFRSESRVLGRDILLLCVMDRYFCD